MRIVTAICFGVVLAALLVGSGRVSKRAHLPNGAARGPQSGCFVISSSKDQQFEAADFADSNNGWAIGISDVWRSSDGGIQWTRVTPPPTRAEYPLGFAQIQALSPEEAWVLENIGLLHTTDSGNSWQVGCQVKDVDISSFRFLDSGNGWAAGYQYTEIKDEPWPYYGAILKTSDGGATWQVAMGAGEEKSVRRLMESELKDTGADVAGSTAFSYSWRLSGIWPISSEEVWAAGDFLFHTVDGGKHWDITDPPDIEDFYGEPFRIGFSGAKRGWLIAHSGGYAITDDGGKTWVVRSHPGNPNELSDMLYLAPNEFWAVSGGVVYLSEDGGDSWKEMARGDYKQISLKNKDHVLMAFLTGGSMRSAGLAVKREDATTRRFEPTLNQSFGLPVWVYFNSSSEGGAPTRAIYIYLFAEPQHFRESDLRKLFAALGAQYPRPASLWIIVASDREFLQRKITLHLAGVPRCTFLSDGRGGDEPDDLPVDSGCFMAEYIRIEGHEEAFEYNPDPHKVDHVKVVLTARPTPYTGQINGDLLIAASEGDVVKAEELLDVGADMETKDTDGDTALMIAAGSSYNESGQSRVAMMLVGRGAEANAKDNEGWSPLLLAAGQEEPDLVRALISKGADLNAKNRHQWTPLMLAAANANAPSVRILLAAGASVNARDDEGKTALIHAVESQNVEIVGELIRNGANASARSKAGESALNYATEHDLDEIVNLLRHAGGNR